MPDAVDVFVGSDPRMAKAESVLEYSLRTNSSLPVAIHWMRAGDPGWEISPDGKGGSWNIGRQPGQPYSGRAWATEFTCFRFAIPELMGFCGRAVYLDVDMLVLGDIREIAQVETPAPWTCARNRPDVSTIDCEAFLNQRWWPRLKSIKASGKDLKVYWNLLRQHGFVGHGLPREWNCLDSVPEGAKLVHYTNMRTQPWKPWPECFPYPDRHPNAAADNLFWDTYEQARTSRRAGA